MNPKLSTWGDAKPPISNPIRGFVFRKYYFCWVSTHEKYMERCIQLARNGLGRTIPNPMVGSVIVHNDRIIGEGWHQKAGAPHAEVNAINAVKNKDLLQTATLYVSLEPCSHYGKTPPCSNMIIESGIKKVIIGCVDPFAAVAGKGITRLIQAGLQVVVGVKEQECRDLNKRFLTFHLKKRPYIILKWAESADGFLGPSHREGSERHPVWISNLYSRQRVHKWRTEEGAILVGTRTALDDNPRLNSRLWEGKDPVRVLLDRQLRVPKKFHLFDDRIPTLILTERSIENSQVLINTRYVKVDFSRMPEEFCKVLWNHEIQSVIVEGGRFTLQSFIDIGLWDEARVFSGKDSLGQGTRRPNLTGRMVSEESVLTDKLKIYRNDQDLNI